jgi:anti-sigma regulatory factor (Ser/Thr protein kinase)/PAS domain-containing protein
VRAEAVHTGDDPDTGLLAELIEASPDGVVVVEPGGVARYASNRLLELFGLDGGPGDLVEQMVGRTRARALTGVLVDRTVGPRTGRVTLEDGRVVEYRGRPLGGGTVAWWFRDVTDHQRVERDRDHLATALQASLLPPMTPHIPGMEVAARYRPAERKMAVGGDFYDVFRLRQNEWCLTIGDVCGSGPKAAALAALARHGARAAAVHAALPSQVLAEVNRAILAEPEADDRFCSAAFARLELDVCGAWLTLACGGHPRPFLVRAAGWIDLRGQPGTLLGLFDDTDLTDDRVGLGPGDALVFCTDGITEARNDDGDLFGEEEMARVLLGCTGQPAEVIADRLLAAAQAFAAERFEDDDAALLVVRVPDDAEADPVGRIAAALGAPGDVSADQLPLPTYVHGDDLLPPDERPAPPREARLLVPGAPTDVRRARAFVASVLASWRMPELAGGAAELLTSELVTNAIRHAGGPVTVVVRYTGAEVRIEVGDSGPPAQLAVPEPDDDALGGRGLLLVDRVADAWGVGRNVRGKHVWFSLRA